MTPFTDHNGTELALHLNTNPIMIRNRGSLIGLSLMDLVGIGRILKIGEEDVIQAQESISIRRTVLDTSNLSKVLQWLQHIYQIYIFLSLPYIPCIDVEVTQ